MSTAPTTTLERIEFVRRRIDERRGHADRLRGEAIGASVYDAERRLKDAQICESLADGMERALAMLFP